MSPDASVVDGSRFAQGLLALFLLSVVGVSVYARGLHYAFIFDDLPSVLQNPTILRLWPLFGDATASGPLVGPAESPTAGRPLVNLSLALNYHFGQYDTFGYHLFNLVVAVFSALLLYAIARRTLELPCFADRFQKASGVLAFLIALIWLVHPLQTEAIQYVTQRTELMMGLCYLGTLYASVRYLTTAAPGMRGTWLTAAGLICLAGMACKEVMVTAPVVVLLFDRTLIAGSFRRALKQSWPLYLTLALTWILLLLLNVGGPRTKSAGFHLDVPAYAWWFTQAKVLAIYAKLVVWPWPLAIHYEMPYLDTVAAAWPWVTPVALVIVGILVLLWRRSVIGFLGACVLLILSPTLVVPIVTEIAVERRMYLPLAAILSLLVAGGYLLLSSFAKASTSSTEAAQTNRWPLSVVAGTGAALAIVFGLVSFCRLPAYSDQITMWETAIRDRPDGTFTQIGLATALNDVGRSQEALRLMEKLLERAPDSAEARLVVGVALVQLDRPQEAAHNLEQLIHRFPKSAEGHSLLAVSYVNLGRPLEAIEQFQIAQQLGFDTPALHNGLGSALANAGRLPEAIAEFEHAVRLKPDFVEAMATLTLLYAKVGRVNDAVAMGTTALKMAKASGNATLAMQIEELLRSVQNR